MNVLLRPPGLGHFSASTGRSPRAERLHRQMYGTTSPDEVRQVWRDHLPSLANTRALLLGVPSDTGAGATRGSALGPIGVREALYASPRAFNGPLGDVGDIFCIPHLLHDNMLAPELIAECRKAVYGDAPSALPVSPLSVTEYVAGALTDRPQPPVLIGIGGDHSVSAALILCHLRQHPQTLGILHLDAHDDLSPARFGVPLTYASWLLYLERHQPLAAVAQLGLEYAEGCSQLSDRLLQFTNTECQGVETVTSRIIEWFAGLGICHLYVSVDVDVTAVEAAPATGTPARQGLSPETVCELISSVARQFHLVGADIVEVAPPLATNNDWSCEPTCLTATTYLTTILQSAM